MVRFRSFQLGPVEIRRDTLMLLVVTIAIPFAAAHRIHKRDLEGTAGAVALERPAWTGQIADLTPSNTSADAITSASLVVPAAALALPQNPARAQAKAPPCLGNDPCSKPTPSVPRQRTAAIVQAPRALHHGRDSDFLHQLNPLAHLPDTVRHPLDSARVVLTGWLRQL